MRRAHVVVPSRNAPDLLDRCLASLADQTGVEFDVCVIDDASDADHHDVARRWCDAQGWSLVRTDHRRGQLHARVVGFDELAPPDDDVVVLLDGDDRLVHPGALAAIVGAHDDDRWMTSGGCRAESVVDEPARRQRAVEMQAAIDWSREVFTTERERVVRTNQYRRIPWFLWQPQSFRAHLLRRVDRDDFRTTTGGWHMATTDMAMLYPIVELAGGRVALLDDVHAAYSIHGSNTDIERSARHRAAMSAYIRSKPRYEALVPPPEADR